MLEELANGMTPFVTEKLERMAASRDPEVSEFYIKTFIEISKFIVPKPVDLTAHVNDEDFRTLYNRFKAAEESTE